MKRRFTTAVVTSIESTSNPSSFFPKKVFADTAKPARKGFRSWKSLAFFVTLNALPAGAAYWYLQNSIEQREKDLASFTALLKGSPLQLAAEVSAVCRGADMCLMSLSTSDVKQVHPHSPEEQMIQLISEFPLASYKYDPLLDVITARYTGDAIPMNYIYIGMPRDALPVEPRVTLTYVNSVRSELAVVESEWEVVQDERLQDFYWKNRWGTKDENYLIKLTPVNATLKATRHPEDSLKPRNITRTYKGALWTNAV